MILKKLLVVIGCAVGMYSTVVVADDFEPVPLPMNEQALYLDAHLGYAQSNWTDNDTNGIIGNTNLALYNASTNGNGGFSGGLDFGYVMMHYFALEAGWLHLPTASGGLTVNGSQGQSITSMTNDSVNSWLTYGALKFLLPAGHDITLFGKVGAAYRSLHFGLPQEIVSPASGSGNLPSNVSSNGHYWAPVFATGVEYNNDNWLMGIQYLYLPGNDCINNGAAGALQGFGAPNAAPEVNLYTGFVGYQFSV